MVGRLVWIDLIVCLISNWVVLVGRLIWLWHDLVGWLMYYLVGYLVDGFGGLFDWLTMC